MELPFIYVIIFGQTVAIAAVIGLVKYRSMLKSYRIFVWFTWLCLIGEGLNVIMAHFYRTNAVNGNIYVFLEAIVLLALFYQWEAMSKKVLWGLIVASVAVWLCDNLVFGTIHRANGLFRLFYALIIVVLSIDQINVIVLYERRKLARNAKFLICCLFAFYYAFKATYEVFYFIPLKVMSKQFYMQLFWIFIYINLLTNLGYAIAALWIPRKQKFTLPY